MAEPTLNFDELTLEQSAGVYDLYSRLYEGMRAANQVTPPDYITNPPLTAEGEVDIDAIQKGLADFSEIQMKNAAYMMASAVVSSVGSGGGGGGGSAPDSGSCVLRTGDSMTGLLSALYGFKAGHSGTLIFETTSDSEKRLAHIYGHLDIDDNATVKGCLYVGDGGIYFSDTQTIFYEDETLHIESAGIKITGDTDVVGEFSVGNITINENGIFNDTNEYYHTGNSNNDSTDWNMLHAYVYGNLDVKGTSTYTGKLTAIGGFSLGDGDTGWLYSHQDETTSTTYIGLSTDLALSVNKGLISDGAHIIMVSNDAISISAPNKVMRLGDIEDETATKYISLQTSIKNYTGDYDIITQYGDGNFKNSFSAGCGNAASAVVATYFTSSEDCGVVFYRNIRIGNGGPVIKSDDAANIVFVMPYMHSSDTEQIPFYISCQDTDSLFKDQSREWSASLSCDTDAEFFVFQKPVESESFSIISGKYKTRLSENTLFFDDSVFVEGLPDGIRISNNAYVDNNLGSMRFASGFAGYGWAIMQSELVGGFTATFDELTVRKKMRIYELEVQKHSITNGSLWVSDACSGDLVEEIV